MTPDLIVYNGNVHTLDTRMPRASALAVTGSRFLAVGTDREILGLAGPETRKIDLAQQLVLPGFWDTHYHFFEWAKNLNSLELAGLQSFKALEGMIQSRATQEPCGTWILGQGFNEAEWPENRIPDRHDLDRAAPDHPLCIWRCDCHLAVANSRALALAGIEKARTYPDGYVVETDSQGNPNGILKELALNLISEQVPKPTPSQLMEKMTEAQARVHKLGITGIHDIRLMGGEDGAESMAAWQSFHLAGRLALRCYVSLPGESIDQACDLGLTTGFGDDRLAVGWVKFFADGGMGARTGWMTEPYLDADHGLPLTPVDDILRGVTKADRAGLSCMVHAIGDRACREMISVFEQVEKKNQSRCRLPHRLEHIQMILPDDLARMSRLKNLAASCQPNNLSLDIAMIDQCVGPRGRYAYALKPIADTGLPLMLSSDAPVADPNPFAGIYSAVTRKKMNKMPENGWYPENRISVAQAVRAYTLTPAMVSGRDRDLGSISPGKLADFVVADQDIFSVRPDDLAQTRVMMTVFNGEVVYGGG